MKYLVWILLIFLVVFRYFSTVPSYKDGDSVRITTVVFSDPINYGNSQYIKLAGLKTYLPVFPEVNYGDEITVEGKVEEGKLVNPKIISVKENRGPFSGVRNKIITFYQTSLPQPMSGLISGIVLGSKGSLTQEFWNNVKNTGVAHVVVASGTNVTFVAGFLMAITTLVLSRKRAIIVVIISIVIYLFISGFDAPLVRAAIMAVLTFTAVEFGRVVSGSRVLFLTAGIMLVIRPDWITDVGFALSFVSTASMMLFEKAIRLKLKFVPGVFKESLSTSLSAQIGVTPILFVMFGQFNIWSPIINVLVLWTIPYIMTVGALAGVMGLLIPSLGRIILWGAYPFTWWFAKMVEIFS